jgi:hypothetical protein
MYRPQMESMEPRLLLTAGVVGVGETAVFDLDGNGVNDAVLANLGTCDLGYEYTEGETGFNFIDAGADGAAFRTNTWATLVGDTNTADDFDLASVLLGKRTEYDGVWYESVLGDSRVEAGSIDYLELGAAGSLGAATSEGDLRHVLLADDADVDIFSTGDIETFTGLGDLHGFVYTMGDLGVLTAHDVSAATIMADGAMGEFVACRLTDGSMVMADSLGSMNAGVIDGGSFVSFANDARSVHACTMVDMTFSTGGDVDCLSVGTIVGSLNTTVLGIGGHVNCFCAGTITGGDGTLSIGVGAGLGYFNAVSMDGGRATGGAVTSTNLTVAGAVDSMYVGTLRGGQADGAGSFAMLNIGVDDLEDGASILEYGDILKLRVMEISGGNVSDGGDAMVILNVSNDLIDAKVGRISGSGFRPAMADPSVYISAGHDIVKFVAGEITGGAAAEDYAYTAVDISAGNDIHYLSAGRIDGGTAGGEYAMTEVRITAGRDIHCLSAVSISGGRAVGQGASTGVNISAVGDIVNLCAGFIGGGRSDNGATAHVKIVAEHDIVHACIGTIQGSENFFGGCDPAVQIQAYNDIKSLSAWRIIAGRNGLVNILAGIDGDGNISGEGDGGSIEYMAVGVINGVGGEINIAAGGDIDYLQACWILSGDGDVNLLAVGDITISVCCAWGWIDGDETGVEIAAGGVVNDLLGSIHDEFITEGQPVELPTPI